MSSSDTQSLTLEANSLQFTNFIDLTAPIEKVKMSDLGLINGSSSPCDEQSLDSLYTVWELVMNLINQFLDGTGNWRRSMLCVAIFIAELTKVNNKSKRSTKVAKCPSIQSDEVII